MKIYTNQISSDGVTVVEDIRPEELDLETEGVKFNGPIRITARVYKITNAITAEVNLLAKVQYNCGRCLEDFPAEISKDFRLNYSASNRDLVIDLNPEIREEIILDYPLKPLCGVDCKGLCLKCGKNLNEGDCGCG